MNGVSESAAAGEDVVSGLFAGWATASVQSKLKGWLDPNVVWISDLALAYCGL